MDALLVPAPTFRFVPHNDGWSAWLAIPHSVTGTSLSLGGSGEVRGAVMLTNSASGTQEGWQLILDHASGQLLTDPLPEAITEAGFARDGRGVRWLLGRELPKLRSAAVHRLDEPTSAHSVALPAGSATLRLLPSGRLACRFVSVKTFRATRVVIGDEAGRIVTIEIPRGFVLDDFAETIGGFVLLGARGETRSLVRTDEGGQKVAEEEIGTTGIQIHNLLRIAEDGRIFATASKGDAIGQVVLGPDATAFEPWFTVLAAATAELTVLPAAIDGDRRTSTFRYVPAGSSISVWGALSVKPGAPVSWLSTVPGHPGRVARPSGIEQIADETIRLDGYDCTDAHEAAVFARELLPCGERSTRFIARVWRR